MLVHLNGALIPADQARVSVFDRGFVFGDGVYEGLRTTPGAGGEPTVIGLAHHVERMRAGVEEARLRGFDAATLGSLTRELVRANGLTDAAVYWQVTRGTPPTGAPLRSRLPYPGSVPTVFGYAVPAKPVSAYTEPEVRRLCTRPDTRWARGHLKSISLLGGVIAAIEADERGDEDAVFIRDGLVTEGTATNVFIAKGGRLATPALDSAPMLAGVTRALILEADPSIEVRPVTERELRDADEVMLTGTYTMVSSGSTLDGRAIGGGGAPGTMSRRLLATLRCAIDRDVHSVHEHAPAARS